MQLLAYLTENGLSDAEFAARIGVSRQAVHRYKTGSRIPDRPTMVRISKETENQVTADDFFGATTQEAAP